MRHAARTVLLALPFLCLAAGSAPAQEVIKGYDVLKTQPGQTYDDLSNLSSMCPGAQVIGNPIIRLRGIPLEDPEKPPCAAGQNIGETDTFILRLATTSGLDIGPAQIPIELAALHLQSVEPFMVNNSGRLEEWTLDVTLEGPQPPGMMVITKSHPNGGTFSSSFVVLPRFTFTQVNPCPAVVVCTAPGPPIQLSSTDAPWSYAPPPDVLQLPGCTSNFFPGVIPGFTQGPAPLQAGFYEQSLLVQHGVVPPPPPKLTQHDWQMAAHFDFWLENTGTGPIDDFHIKNARWIPMTPPAALPDSTIFIKSVSICDLTPFCPTTPPDRWCRVDWDPASLTYRRVANWHFPPVQPGGMAPPMDIVFSIPCGAPPGLGAWYEVNYVCTFNCVPVDSGLFRFHCPPEPPCPTPVGCRDNQLTGVGPETRGQKIEILQQNAPNPFYPSTTIQFLLDREGPVALRVYDAQGRLVKNLVDGRRPAGQHAVIWDGRDEDGRSVSTGTYFYQIEIAGVRQAKRMIVLH